MVAPLTSFQMSLDFWVPNGVVCQGAGDTRPTGSPHPNLSIPRIYPGYLGPEMGTLLQGCFSHFPEPHQPHLTLEAGSLSAAEYEARVRARRDFQRLQRRDSDSERQVCLPRYWLHLKDKQAGA